MEKKWEEHNIEKKKGGDLPIANSPRTHRPRAPFLSALVVFIPSWETTLSTDSLTLGVRGWEIWGRRCGDWCVDWAFKISQLVCSFRVRGRVKKGNGRRVV